MDEHSIIFVDDEKQIRAMYLRAFSAPGTRVRAVASAEECLEVMAKDPAPVLFLDLNLPGMDGVALCRRLREGWPGLVEYGAAPVLQAFRFVLLPYPAAGVLGQQEYRVLSLVLQAHPGALNVDYGAVHGQQFLLHQLGFVAAGFRPCLGRGAEIGVYAVQHAGACEGV